MCGYKTLSQEESDSLIRKTSRFRSVMDFRSIFTYTSEADLKRKKEKSKKVDHNKNMAKYSTLPQKDVEPLITYQSAFDYKSIFSYSSGSSKLKVQQQCLSSDPGYDETEMSSINIIMSNLVLMLSYVFVFFTLPLSVWFCFKHLSQWERIVVYRLGKLHGVLGPGNIFIIPWLDNYTKLDLRTQLISHPVKEVYS